MYRVAPIRLTSGSRQHPSRRNPQPKSGKSHGKLALALALLAFASSACERRQHLVEQHLLEFGTIIEVTLIAEDLSHAESLLGEIEKRLRDFRYRWHAWEDSDLTRFNTALRRDGQAPVPPSLEALLELCFEYHAASNGLFCLLYTSPSPRDS